MNKRVILLIGLLLVTVLAACGGGTLSDADSVEQIVASAGDGNVDGGLFGVVVGLIALMAIIVGVVSYYRSGIDKSEDAALISLLKGGIAAIVLFVVYLILKWIAGLYVDYLWFQDHGYAQVFWVTKGLPWALGIVFGWLACLAIWIAGNRFFPIEKAVYIAPKRDWSHDRMVAQEKERVQQINLRRFLLNLIPVILGLVMGVFAASVWDEAALFFAQEQFGRMDPIFFRDVSFYVFSVPFFSFLNTWLVVLVVCVGANGVARWYFKEYESDDLKEAQLKRFVGIITIPMMVLFAWGFWITKFYLLLDNNGSFTGASYADVEGGRLLRFYALSAMAVIAILPIVHGIRKERIAWYVIPCLAVVMARLLVGAEGVLVPVVGFVLVSWIGIWFLDFFNGEQRLQLRTVVSVASIALVFVVFWSWPAIIQTIRVNPNELAYEKEYIRQHINFTRYAYGLDKVETVEFPYVDSFTGTQYSANADILEESRTFGWREVREQVNERQTRETYYEVLDTDLYYVDGQMWMTNPRELLPGQILNPNFVNNHMRFLCGFGMVAAEPNVATPQGEPWYVASQLPTVGDERFIPQNQRICYGEGTTSHVYVNTSEEEIVPGSVEPTEFTGQRGVAIGSGTRRVAFALSFGSIRLLTSDAITSDTRVLYHRQIDEMLDRLAPFITWDSDPFLVAAEDQYVWINEGVVVTGGYPYSVQKSGLSGDDYHVFNYARPGITGMVYAYDGEVHIYADRNPLLAAWNNVIPGLLQPLDEIPDELVQNRRYPYDYFQMQAELYGLYHLADEQAFYGKTRMWLPTTESAGQSGVVESEARYVVTRLPLVSDDHEFVLSLGFVQTTLEEGQLTRKQNLGSILVARMAENYGDLIAYEMPDALSIPSPVSMHSQVQDAITDQNLATLVTGESQTLYWSDFTLLPLMNDAEEGTLVGIQPLYKTTDGLPIVTRVFVITSRGEVYHGGSLQEALEGLYSSSDKSVAPSSVEDTVPDGNGSSCERYRMQAIDALEAKRPEAAARLTIEYWACTQ